MTTEAQEPIHPDGAQPAVPEVQQLEVPPIVGSVPVRVDGPIQVQRPPSRNSAAEAFALGSQPLQVLRRDLRRARAVLVSSAAWNYRRRQTSETCPIPANVPLVLEHGDEVWATGTDATLTVISEYYAD